MATPKTSLPLALSTLVIAVLTMVMPLTAFADSVDFTNSGGTLAGSAAGLSLSGSTLIDVNGLSGGGLITGSLGTVSFSTSALSGGSLMMGGTFSLGGTFVISGNGTNGIPNSVIFSGSFSGPVAWTLDTLASGADHYELTGSVTGTWFDGSTVGGTTDQITVDTGTLFGGIATLSDGTTVITTVVPEPGTLGFLGAGLLSLAGVLRRKQKV